MKEITLITMFIIGIFFIPIAGWVGKSYFEAKAYERVTGKEVSTWDAMWLELRVTP